ncbi:hypothetical protein KGQ20_04040 [Catenulispora sp. NF23]|uniref:hypothetical protein n=1 Tax=Catenulispora pinistramenti TaxID=2705254 RepID=UPI001BA78475|nr:hypothetical protein [Catenulispora pinistramenti]MBS2531934.1 hypothetical protein [Catenulispora pinistramenti]
MPTALTAALRLLLAVRGGSRESLGAAWLWWAGIVPLSIAPSVCSRFVMVAALSARVVVGGCFIALTVLP